MNEFIGYLHASNSSSWNIKDGKLLLNVDYDPHYCQDFEGHETTWNLEFSDWLLQEMGPLSTIMVDGKKIAGNDLKIQIPRGTGSHRIEVSF